MNKISGRPLALGVDIRSFMKTSNENTIAFWCYYIIIFINYFINLYLKKTIKIKH